MALCLRPPCAQFKWYRPLALLSRLRVDQTDFKMVAVGFKAGSVGGYTSYSNLTTRLLVGSDDSLRTRDSSTRVPLGAHPKC